MVKKLLYPGRARFVLEQGQQGCADFDLTRDLGYSLPAFETSGYESANAALASYCRNALDEKYDSCLLPSLRRKAEERIDEELRLIRMHRLSGFFLVYRNIVQIIREVCVQVRGTGPRGRLTQPPVLGRGSSVSSIVCYLIGLSRVDPVASDLFLGRFLNEGLQSLPNIDIDMPRDVREQVILRVYERYGRDLVAEEHHAPCGNFNDGCSEVC